MSRENAALLVALRVLKDEIGKTDSTLRAEVEAGMQVGDRTTASIPGPDGTPVPIGHVQRKNGSGGGSVTARVTDEQALLGWARRHASHLITEHLNSAAQRALLDIVKTAGGWPDPATGEVLDIPGIERDVSAPGRPVLEVRPAAGAEALVKAAWADGRLTIPRLLAIPAGEA